MSKHTPEWSIDANGPIKDQEGVECLVIWGPEGEGFGRVAMIYDEVVDGRGMLEKARLITQAPALLEALEDLAEQYDTWRYLGDAAAEPPDTIAARAAIKEARA